MSTPTPFHRLFGYSWIDFFDGTDIQVETELDMSVKLQLIDLVIVRKGVSPVPRRMPDGLEELTTFTLMTFKSYQEALDAWTLWELIGHFVNYCKRVSPAFDRLLPLDEFQLFAVTVRFPAKLAGEMTLVPVKPGVFDLTGFGLRIRIIVVNELPQEEHNAMLHQFSPSINLLEYAREHYRPHSAGTSSLLYRLLRAYGEDPTMSEKLKEFIRQTIDEMLQTLPAEERLKGLPAEERLKGLPAEERLKGLSTEEVVKALPPEVLEALARKIKGNGVAPKGD